MNQPSQEPLTQILQNALSGNDSLRKEAESQITRLASENLSQFLITISSKISNEQEEKRIRQISATLIKNIISKDEYTQKYLNLDQKDKTQIKNHVLSTLASQDIDIRKAAGNAIASICKIEIPNKEWLDIFDTLVNTSQNENLYIQLASITTLGFIFTEISPNDIPQDTIAKILNCFYTILKKDNLNLELWDNTLKAILNFIPFISAFVTNDSQKIVFFDLIKSSLINTDKKIINDALLIFMELIRLYYDNFNNYFNTLLEVTKNIMINADDDNKIVAYEIWCSIGDIEAYRIKKGNLNNLNFCEKAYQELLPILFSHLKTTDYNSDEWTLRKASGSLLNLFSQCCQYQFIDSVLKFIGENINQYNADLTNMSLFAFISILETQHHSQLFITINQSLEMISNFLCDEKTPDHLKEVCAWTIERICDSYGLDILNDKKNTYGKLIELILSLLPKMKRKVCVNLCNGLNSLIKIINNDSNSNELSPFCPRLINTLITLATQSGSYNTENNVSLACFFTIGTIAEHSAKDVSNVIISNFNILFEMYKKTLNPTIFPDNDMRNNYQIYIITTLSSFVLYGGINDSDLVQLYNSIITAFKQRNSVFDEAMTLVGSIALSLEQKFDNLMQDFNQYLSIGLNSTQDAGLCRASIHCMSDIIRSLNNLFSKYISFFFPGILQILSNPDIDKSLKPHAFNVISDLFYCCPNDIFPYYNSIMNLLGSALQAAMNIQNFDDSENIEYFQDLREHIIETLTCIFNSITDINKQDEFIIYVGPIFTFINTICLDQKCISAEILKSSLGLIGDFCKAYGKNIKNLINPNVVQSIIENLKKPMFYNTDQNIGKIIHYGQKMVENVLSS